MTQLELLLLHHSLAVINHRRRFTDIANFDLGFRIDDDDNLDSSAYLFD